MSDSPQVHDTSGWGERRRRRLEERLAAGDAATSGQMDAITGQVDSLSPDVRQRVDDATRGVSSRRQRRHIERAVLTGELPIVDPAQAPATLAARSRIAEEAERAERHARETELAARQRMQAGAARAEEHQRAAHDTLDEQRRSRQELEAQAEAAREAARQRQIELAAVLADMQLRSGATPIVPGPAGVIRPATDATSAVVRPAPGHVPSAAASNSGQRPDSLSHMTSEPTHNEQWATQGASGSTGPATSIGPDWWGESADAAPAAQPGPVDRDPRRAIPSQAEPPPISGPTSTSPDTRYSSAPSEAPPGVTGSSRGTDAATMSGTATPGATQVGPSSVDAPASDDVAAQLRTPRPAQRPVVKPPVVAAAETYAAADGADSALPKVKPRGVRPGAPQMGADPLSVDAPAPRPARSVREYLSPVEATQRRPYLWWAIGGVAALLALTLVIVLINGPFKQRNNQNAAADVDRRPPRTLAVVLADDAAPPQMVQAALLGATPQGATMVTVPGELLMDVPGAGSMPLSRSLQSGDAAPSMAIQDGLDVRVDATWVVTSRGFENLVDRVGGIRVDVKDEINSGPHRVPAGNAQLLDGKLAYVYASAGRPGEPAAARAARFTSAMTAVLSKVPSGKLEAQALVTSLGSGARTPQGEATVAETLARVVEKSDKAASLNPAVLPIREVQTGGDTPAWVPNVDEVTPLLKNKFGDAYQPAGADALRVLVQNGVGSPGLALIARDKLLAAQGLRFMGGGNAPKLDQPQSFVVVRDQSGENQRNAAKVQESLGLPFSSIRTWKDADPKADVLVILGKDFEEANKPK